MNYTNYDDGQEFDGLGRWQFKELPDGQWVPNRPEPAYQAWQRLRANSFTAALTPDEAKEAKAYGNYVADYLVNEQLRGFNPPSQLVSKRIDILTSAINKTSLSEGVVTWRGLDDEGWADLQNHVVGSTFKEPAFISVSLRKGLAQGYCRFREGHGGGLVEVQVPKGAKALPIVNTEVAPQTELVLQRGSTYKVLSKTPHLVVLALMREGDHA